MSSSKTIPRFGTDGWRAVVGEDFTDDSVVRVAEATAHTFLAAVDSATSPAANPADAPILLVGYDTRADASSFARLVAETMAGCGVRVVLSDRYLPTPALCWAVAHDIVPAGSVAGGVQLTASHNTAEYLGFKVRLADGGAAGVDFTRQIEAQLEAAWTTVPTAVSGSVITYDFVTPYLDALRQIVDTNAIAAAVPRLLVDPLFGAARGYLGDLLAGLGCEVMRLHDEADPSFGGLHPEPIPPWTDAAAAFVHEHHLSAGFITDGDADRIGALDEDGTFVSPHKIIALVAQHLVEDKGQKGRIIKTLSTSVLVDRIGRELACPVTTTSIGFKWIYEEMLAGDVLIGGEESGGIGLPTHVRERDGLLMALLLTEMMAQRDASLKELVAALEARVGQLFYDRHDVRLKPEAMRHFRRALSTLIPMSLAGIPVKQHIHTDGAKFLLPDDEWLLLRSSGTEPLVRIYAEANTPERLEILLAAGQALVTEVSET